MGIMSFEKVNNFKYLGVSINNKNNMHRRIKEYQMEINVT